MVMVEVAPPAPLQEKEAEVGKWIGAEEDEAAKRASNSSCFLASMMGPGVEGDLDPFC